MTRAIDRAADHILRSTTVRPRVAVTLGSGLSGFTGSLEIAAELPYSRIPSWPASTAAGHDGKLVIGELAGTPVAVLAGRVHLYEGYSASEAAFGVRTLGRIGVETIIITNAAGAVNPNLRPGQLVLISDHINLQGANPLVGPNDDELGPRFPDMTAAYSPRLLALADNTARQLGAPLPRGVYAAVLGPNYETPAEIRFLQTAGADLVGMSTVPEVIAARHLGIEVLGISLVTNLAAGLSDTPPSHDEVLARAQASEATLTRLLTALIPAV